MYVWCDSMGEGYLIYWVKLDLKAELCNIQLLPKKIQNILNEIGRVIYLYDQCFLLHFVWSTLNAYA